MKFVSYHTPPEIASFSYSVTKADAYSINALKSELRHALGVVRGPKGPGPLSVSKHPPKEDQHLGSFTILHSVTLKFQGRRGLEMYGRFEMWDVNSRRGRRAHNHNEFQPNTKMTQFREEYDSFINCSWCFNQFDHSSLPRLWRPSSLSLCGQLDDYYLFLLV